MIALRLFRASDVSQQLDVRTIDDGEELTIGRDSTADWALPDPDRSLSRSHMKIALSRGCVTVTDTSTNGVILANSDERMQRDQPVNIEAGEGLKLGPYLLLVEHTDKRRVVQAPARVGNDPFTPATGVDPRTENKRRIDPFASALPVDPIGPGLAGGSPIGQGDLGISGQDAWSRRGERHAGDWDAPKPVAEPVEMIGSTPTWSEPPREATSETGFGFDTPFKRPLMSRGSPEPSDLAIPSDWDAPPSLAPEQKTPVFVEALNPEPPPPLPLLAPAPVTPTVSERADPKPPAVAEQRPFLAASPELATVVEPFDPKPPELFEPLIEEPIVPAPVALTSIAEPLLEPPAPDPAPSLRIDTQIVMSEAAPRETPTSEQASGEASTKELFEAFCAGARLDPGAFAREDILETMTRLGTMYRHMVLGLSDLMSERTALRSEYRMIRTSVRSEDNNPFKWAPPQKIATELLRAHNEGFLDGPTAVTESFRDVKKHLLCMLAGLRAALTSTLDTLAPTRIEEGVKDQSSILKSRAALAWEEYVKLYAQYRRESEDSADSPINREFRDAYERQLVELDRSGQR